MLSSLQPKVAIVILNYNTRSLLERFLDGVLATSYGNKEVWVVDNASTDDSVAYLEQHHKAKYTTCWCPQKTMDMLEGITGLLRR